MFREKNVLSDKETQNVIKELRVRSEVHGYEAAGKQAG